MDHGQRGVVGVQTDHKEHLNMHTITPQFISFNHFINLFISLIHRQCDIRKLSPDYKIYMKVHKTFRVFRFLQLFN